MSLRDHLQTIYEQRGQLTPAIVVEEARPKNHPLHAAVFDRTPKEAAEAWYLHRARALIRLARVRYVADDGDQHHVRAFHSIERSSGFVYEPVEEVVADDISREIVLRQMEREWRALHSRYRHFEEFAEMVSRDLSQNLVAA